MLVGWEGETRNWCGGSCTVMWLALEETAMTGMSLSGTVPGATSMEKRYQPFQMCSKVSKSVCCEGFHSLSLFVSRYSLCFGTDCELNFVIFYLYDLYRLGSVVLVSDGTSSQLSQISHNTLIRLRLRITNILFVSWDYSSDYLRHVTCTYISSRYS